MKKEDFVLVGLLKGCTQNRDLQKGTRLHAEIRSKGLLGESTYVASTLINMYAKFGMLETAKEVLHELPFRDVISWNALMIGYAQVGQCDEAVNCFGQMQREGLSPDVVTFISCLKACGGAKNIAKGKQIHDVIMNRHLIEKDVVLGNALVDMYAKCSALVNAQQVLEELLLRNVVSWSALIAGYVRHGEARKALDCFERMRSEGCFPDAVTFSSILKACGSIGAISWGKKIHESIVSRGLLGKDIVLGTTLVDMYAKCGALSKAQEVLEGLHHLANVVSWNALIAGYAQQGQGHEALHCFERMQSKGLYPDVVTFTCTLKACGSTGAIETGKRIHDEILQKGFLMKDNVLGNALVDMYAKCGMLDKAQQVLEELPVRNIISWNALIAGHAQRGNVVGALSCFHTLQSDGLSPDEVTLQCILRACAYAGLGDEVQMIVAGMMRNSSLVPSREHRRFFMMVLGCAGLLHEAMALVKVMPSSDHPVMLLEEALNACRRWRNWELGRLAFDGLLQPSWKLQA